MPIRPAARKGTDTLTANVTGTSSVDLAINDPIPTTPQTRPALLTLDGDTFTDVAMPTPPIQMPSPWGWALWMAGRAA